MGRHKAVLLAVFLIAGCREAATLTLADGGQQDLRDYRGRWLVVNYFAEWCVPCLRELPLLNELAQTAEPAVLAVSFDSMPSQALQKLIARYDMQMPVVAKLAGHWPFERPRVLPTTFIINPQGELASQHQGELKAEDIASLAEQYWGQVR
ncbi:TlpA disulfide reductase family protein [Zobellella maritima]|uniref:TlpA disulfide reductase family protein n=1 Tax=Zobellella maritima TaxID=2059725 RepID=UPI000E304C39|nr:TlpA disulfide reductase family protein [Zobellella maritima]